MSYFSTEALADLHREARSVAAKQAALQERFLRREFREARAKEFAHHGFLRRLIGFAAAVNLALIWGGV